MGVQGLWSILNCSGKDVDLSILEGKILAIDLSIWLNQALKSSNDLPNAHLQILFNRICKLLFYQIKPIFVFDGPTPTIKRHALELRRKIRQLKNDKTEQIRSNIINILMKKNLIEKKRTAVKPHKEESDPFKLSDDKSEFMQNWRPSLDSEFTEIAADYISNFSNIDDVDVVSPTFHSLPLEVQHEILRTVSKEKRYGLDISQNNYNDMNANDFSSLQIKRLLDRNNLHVRVDNLRSTMNDRDGHKIISSSKLNAVGDFSNATVSAKKIISQDKGYLMLIDPLNDDFIQSLSASKREAMFKGKRVNLPEETTDDTMRISSFGETTNNRSFEESDDVLNDQDLCSIMKSVTKLKKNTREPPIFVSPIPDSSDEYSPACVILPMQASVGDPSIISNKTMVGLLSNEPESEKNIDSETTDDVLTIATNLNAYEEISEERHIANTSPDHTASNGITQPDKDESLKDDSEDDESAADFIDVSEKEEDNCDFEDARAVELGTTIEEQKLIYSVVKKPSEYRTDLDSSEDGLSEMGFIDADLQAIAKDPDSWRTSIDGSLAQLFEQDNKLEHQATSMSEHYFLEAKELLKLFGIPFVDSLAEAEAQCAYLESIGLTNGTITEDSDIWLFGGKTVYKHTFTRGFHVREYKSERIYKKLGLSRDLMICIALLSGGDYTPGIFGVGPVNAMEILAEFSDPDVPMTNFQVLEQFKNWSEKHNNETTYSGDKERKRFLKFELGENFPDRTVYEAYNKPLVDESREPFVWSPPATDRLIEYIHTKLGWEKLKIIEMLEVALRSNSKSSLSQRKITDYFDESQADYQRLPSKRLKLAARQRNLIAKNLLKENK